MATNWFEDLFGFSERSYDTTQRNLEVVGTTLRSRINQRTYAIGELQTPSVKDLRDAAARVAAGLRGRLNVSTISGDVRRMHGNPAHRNALFQVASQFNLLEMTGPDVSPEDGVTRYVLDHTQGACRELWQGGCRARAPCCGVRLKGWTRCISLSLATPSSTIRRTRVALMPFNDVILRVAFEHHASVIDLRLVCSERADYANPIEPSGVGGMKIARAITRATGARLAGERSACFW